MKKMVFFPSLSRSSHKNKPITKSSQDAQTCPGSRPPWPECPRALLGAVRGPRGLPRPGSGGRAGLAAKGGRAKAGVEVWRTTTRRTSKEEASSPELLLLRWQQRRSLLLLLQLLQQHACSTTRARRVPWRRREPIKTSERRWISLAKWQSGKKCAVPWREGTID